MPRKKKSRSFPSISNHSFTYPYLSKVKVDKAKYNDSIKDMYSINKLIHDEYGKKHIPDVKMKPLTRYFRPSFSPHLNSWIIDLAFAKGNVVFLFIINENTRFLEVYSVIDRSTKSIYES
jgi:hypothetical protein